MNKGIMKNTGIGIFFILFAHVYLFGTSQIKSFSPFGSRGLDSQSVPQMLGVLMIMLSALHIAVTVHNNRRSMADNGEGESRPKRAKKLNPVVLGSIALLIAYILLYQNLGFLLSTFAYLVSVTTLLTPPPKRRRMALFIVPFSAVTACAIYFIFTKYLTLMLPQGILG